MNRRAHLVLLAGSVAWRVHAAEPKRLHVVTSTTDLESLARLIGGPRVTTYSLATGAQDPHEIELTPGFTRELDRADLFLQVGLGLENAWLERLMNTVKNPAVKPGQSGNFNFDRGVRPLEGEEAEGIPAASTRRATRTTSSTPSRACAPRRKSATSSPSCGPGGRTSSPGGIRTSASNSAPDWPARSARRTTISRPLRRIEAG